MDIPTISNCSIVFHDVPNSPFTLISFTITNVDGSISKIGPFEVLKNVADTARAMAKATLINFVTRSSADTVL